MCKKEVWIKGREKMKQRKRLCIKKHDEHIKAIMYKKRFGLRVGKIMKQREMENKKKGRKKEENGIKRNKIKKKLLHEKKRNEATGS